MYSQPGDEVGGRGIDQREYVRELEEPRCGPTPTQASCRDPEDEAGTKRRKSGAPHQKSAEWRVQVMAMNHKGICGRTEETEKSEEDG